MRLLCLLGGGGWPHHRLDAQDAGDDTFRARPGLSGHAQGKGAVSAGGRLLCDRRRPRVPHPRS